MIIFNRTFLSKVEVDALKTLDSTFKGAVFVYLSQALGWNKQNVRNFTFRICKERFLLSQRSFFFPRDFYLIEEINYQLSLLYSSGILARQLSIYADNFFLNVKAESSEPLALNVEQISGIMNVWLACLAISTIVFAGEIIQKFCKFQGTFRRNQ